MDTEELALDAKPQDDAREPGRLMTWAQNAHLRASGLAVLGLLSFFVGARLAAAPTFVNGVRESLDSQEATVATMAASSTALSAALSAIPTDALMPLAQRLADLSGWFMVILASIILQKIFFTAAGFLSFKIVFPIACALGIASVYGRSVAARAIAQRLAVLGVVLFAAVPGAIWFSGQLTANYTETVEAAAVAQAQAEALAEAEAEAAAAAEEAAASGSEDDAGFLDRVQDWASGAADTVGGWVESATGQIAELRDEAVDALNGYIEQIALLLITTCVMPLLVFMLFSWVIRLLFNVDLGGWGTIRRAQSQTSRGVQSLGRRRE